MMMSHEIGLYHHHYYCAVVVVAVPAMMRMEDCPSYIYIYIYILNVVVDQRNGDTLVCYSKQQQGNV